LMMINVLIIIIRVTITAIKIKIIVYYDGNNGDNNNFYHSDCGCVLFKT
jgi:hypothetical protein